MEFLPDDAIVVIMADHGEELHHGNIGHARLYEECVKVPLFIRHPDATLHGQSIRQLDIAPTLAEWIASDIPDQWHGEPPDGETRDSLMINRSPGMNRVYLGLRTADAKLIESYDLDGNLMQTEFYDLSNDPTEQNLVTDTSDTTRKMVKRKLTRYKKDRDVMSHIFDDRAEPSEPVQQRLEELGYK
jgi:arylsulfatase A-like enzyme